MYIPIIRNYKQSQDVFVENGRQDYPLRDGDGNRVGAMRQLMNKNGDLWGLVELDGCDGLCAVRQGKSLSHLISRDEIEFKPYIERVNGCDKLTAWQIQRTKPGTPAFSEGARMMPQIPESALEKRIKRTYGTPAQFNESTQSYIPESALEKRIKQVYGIK